MRLSHAFLIRLYATMLRIRCCEESLVDPILKGDVRCPVHLCTGQEAVAAGVGAALRKGDRVFGNHRSHGHYLATGGELAGLVAEVFGKESGCSRGRGGSMHVCSPRTGFMGAAPIVAGTVSLALGSALASSIKRDGRVSVSFFGDGATGEGVIYESLNFAALRKLPIVFCCENNLYSTHLSIDDCRPDRRIYRIGMPFGIKSVRCDGNDCVKVYAAAKEAVERCARGKGPAFIEFMTYRMRGHVGPDDNIQGTHTDIRPPAEVARWKRRDPVLRMEKLLRALGVPEKALALVRETAQNEVRDAFTACEKAARPSQTELLRYVFSEKTSL